MMCLKTLKYSNVFPLFIEEDENIKLMNHISDRKSLGVLHHIQKYKSPKCDGWSMEFFQHFYDMLGFDLLRVVDDSLQNGRILKSFTSTFIALMPKSHDPTSFD